MFAMALPGLLKANSGMKTTTKTQTGIVLGLAHGIIAL